MLITNQDLFDSAWQRFIVDQEPKCATENADGSPVCLYRDEKGRSCLIGGFIPDKEYDESFEGENVEDIQAWTSLEFENIDFAEDAQQALHDSMADDATAREAEFRAFAASNGLAIPG